MSKRVADILVETLEAAGVKNCYGIVGDTMNQIAHSIHRSSIDFVHVRHEDEGRGGGLQLHEPFQRAEVVAEVQAAGGLDAGQDASGALVR